MNAEFKKPARALIEAAERLIASEGLSVPLRDIGQAAGAANKVAVQYHFGDRERLIDAVFRYRLPQLEKRRAELLTAAGPDADAAALLDALLRPIAEIRDADGRRSYAGFLYQHTAFDRGSRAAFNVLSPVAVELNHRLRAALPHVPETLFWPRLGSAALVFLDSLRNAEREGTLEEDAAIAEALRLALAVLGAGCG